MKNNQIITNFPVFNYQHFQNIFNKYYPNISIPDKNFLQWFIGFSEGNLCFNNNSNKFVIKHKNIQVLHYIQNKIGLGKVIKTKYNNYYTLQNSNDKIILANLFNNNLVLPTSIQQFKLWIKKNSIHIQFSNNSIINKPYNLWISGFIDSNAKFHYKLTSNKSYRFLVIFKLKNTKNIPILNLLKNMFGGQVKAYPMKHVYQLQIQGLFNMDKIIEFINDYQLIANKKSYNTWKHLNHKAKIISNSGNKDNGLNNIRQVYLFYLYCIINEYNHIQYRDDHFIIIIKT
uniref:Putative LAGLIDADG homing endonuclease n=1 Tax=Malassezia furfur TaxID=55194 RepID=A0A8K1I5H4_MALFU|nr:putative LAGLIDADG homing endonuclease [Malassezia furfur]